MVRKLLDVILMALGCIGLTMLAILVLCIFITVFSMALECVTGFDLIREVIRPFFQHLR